ncbi:MAG TPA: hypothetical protein ENK00_04870 [Chromatiales bacterium]|nr:hypothetical protein [Chromatiales bacterium]
MSPARAEAPRAAARQAGLGLLEFVLAAIVISILIVVFFSRVVRLSEAVERTAVQQTVNNLDSVIKLKWLTHLVRNEQDALRAMVGSNPMRLLQEPPVTYLGELDRPDPAAIPPQRWYFDTRQRLLVYRVANPRAIEGGAGDPPRIRFRVEAVRDGEGKIQGIEMRPLEPYQWRKAS